MSCACEKTLIFCFVLSVYNYVCFLTLCLLQVEHLSYGDKWVVMAALTGTRVFEGCYVISLQNYRGDELLITLSRSESFSSVDHSRCLHTFPPNDKDPYTDHAD